MRTAFRLSPMLPCPVSHNRIEILTSPFNQSLYMWQERAPELRDRVFRSWRHVGIKPALEKPVGTELPQYRREYFLR